LIHACNNGLGDYTRPLAFMSAIILATGATKGEEESEAVLYAGHMILSYIGMLFAGQALPRGRLPVDVAARVLPSTTPTAL